MCACFSEMYSRNKKVFGLFNIGEHFEHIEIGENVIVTFKYVVHYLQLLKYAGDGRQGSTFI